MFDSVDGWYETPDYDAYRKCFKWTGDPPNLPKIPEAPIDTSNIMHVTDDYMPSPGYDSPQSDTFSANNVMYVTEDYVPILAYNPPRTDSFGANNVMYVPESVPNPTYNPPPPTDSGNVVFVTEDSLLKKKKSAEKSVRQPGKAAAPRKVKETIVHLFFVIFFIFIIY